MKMKKTLCSFLVVCVFAIHLFTSTNIVHAIDFQTAEESIANANIFLQETMGFAGNYYETMHNGKSVNPDLAKAGTEGFSNRPVFVYGNQKDASRASTTNGRESDVINGVTEYRALGYARDDSVFPNPVFTHDNDGYKATDKKWISKPWPGDQDGNRTLFGEDGTTYMKKLTSSRGGGLDYIGRWIKDNTFTPETVGDSTGKKDFFTANALDAPEAIRGHLEDFLYIIQPPTQSSWGLGIVFYYWDGYFRLNYRTILLKPFDMMINDLSAHFEKFPSRAAEGTEVTVAINVRSTFKVDVKDTAFKWSITKADGTPINAVLRGDAAVPEGKISISTAPQNEAVLYATFTMPDTDVQIKFEINKDGTNPVETYLDNNVLDSKIKIASPIKTVGQFDIPYNVLTKKVGYPLVNGLNITAQLGLPGRAWWNGNATGALNVENDSPNVLNDFSVGNNPRVNEASATIVRRPTINATLQRTDFGDNPVGRDWLNLPDPLSPKTLNGSASFFGSVSRPYQYNCGSKDCTSCPHDGTATSDFSPGTDTRRVRTFIYNGRQHIPEKSYKNDIDHNALDQLKKKMFWTSEPYDYDVIRWMCHMNEDSTLYGWTPVDGQYERTFTQQCSGDVTWGTTKSMAQHYQQSREAAKNRVNNKSQYDKAVFATDRELQNEDYPIKSGYYFNPAGTYTFNIETEVYKPTTANTKDHEDLVDAVIDSFRYESDLMYINSGKEPVNLRNELLSMYGNNFERRPAILTAKDNKGVDGATILTVKRQYSKEDVEEIEHSQVRDNNSTDDRWKNILEGYSQSGTIGSYNNFLYREYVKEGQHMYKITEKTTVTITINANNRNVYTHARMQDGEYRVKVWIDDTALSRISGNHAYERLGTLKGISVLDEITVTVTGSMYDDVNN